MKREKISVIFLCVLWILLYCGGEQVKNENKDTGDLTNGVLRTILLAEAIENIDQKNNLLKQAYDELQKNEAELNKEKKKKLGASQDNDTLLALYFIVKGDTSNAQLYVDKFRGLSNKKPLSIVAESRLLLIQKGAAVAKSVISDLDNAIKRKPKMTLAHLVKGDAYYLLMEINSAKNSYKQVLRFGGVLQILAADRLEIINKIENTKLDPKKFQNYIFAKSLKRGEVADILYRVYAIHNRFRTKKKETVTFTDIEKSVYADSIKNLKQVGFFSYISGDLFLPLKDISRREMALIIEDYLVFSKGNNTFRQRYKDDKTSSISNLSVSDAAYNAVQLSVKYEIIDLSLSGAINLDEPISGLEGLIIVNKMLKK